MKIGKIRIAGFDYNSSSCHSVVLIKGNELPTTDEFDDNSEQGNSYGWNDFRLCTKGGKLSYLAAILGEAVRQRSLPPDYLDYYAQWVSETELDPKSEIDHASCISLPAYYDNRTYINKEFFDEFKEYLTRENVVIYGGNDNVSEAEWEALYRNHDSKKYDISTDSSAPLYEMMEGGDDLISRKDAVYNYWTVMNTRFGTKVNLAFNDAADLTKASIPESVDLCITHKCPYGCSFCYMDSKPNGEHASLAEIKKLIDTLAKLQVFEVAFGGGEPTLHPNFNEIIRYTYSKGIVPNFTTRNVRWFTDNENVKLFRECAGGCAISVSDWKEAREAIVMIKYLQCFCTQDKGIHRDVTVQVIDGRLDTSVLSKIKDSGVGVVLLGFKNTGRARNVVKWRHVPYKDVMELNICGIDSVYYAEHKEEINKAFEEEYGAEYYKEYLNHIVNAKEGVYTMFIDAVTGKMGPYSFCPNTELVDIPEEDEDDIPKYISKYFKRISEEYSVKEIVQN